MRTRRYMQLLTALILSLSVSSFSLSAQAQTTTQIDCILDYEGAAELYIGALGGSKEFNETTKMEADGNHFTAQTETAELGFYSLAAAIENAQQLQPVYQPKTLYATLTDGVLTLKGDTDNEALSAYSLCSAKLDMEYWMKGEEFDDSEVLPFILRYQGAADSIIAARKCSPEVQQYLRLWSTGDMIEAYESIPRALRKSYANLPFMRSEVMSRVDTLLLKSPLASCHPSLMHHIANTLRADNLNDRLASLYRSYDYAGTRTRVASLLVDRFMSRFDYTKNFEAGLNELKEAVATYQLDTQYVDDFQSRRALAKGVPFPADITLVDSNGEPVDFAKYRGKYVYIDLWASWCVPCIREVPYLQDLESTLGRDDVVFVSISIDTKVDAWKKKMEALKLKGNQLLCQDNSIGKAYNVQGIPYFLIFDREGCLYMADAPRPSNIELRNILLNLR